MSDKIERFLINTGLYDKFEISKEDTDELRKLLDGVFKIELYCPSCKAARTFISDEYTTKRKSIGGGTNPPMDLSIRLPINNDTDKEDVVTSSPDDILEQLKQLDYEKLLSPFAEVKRDFLCARDPQHKTSFYLQIKQDHIEKVGQYPALAEITAHSSNKYRRLLKEKYTELTKATGLFSHGIGIGSFVYLRRIFEGLIEEAHTQALTLSEWDEPEYSKSRMSEKILLLKPFLPPFLVQHRKIYGILSKGIHELSEDECKRIFPTVKIGIELILDEKLEKLEKEKKIKEISSQLEDIERELKPDDE